ncbi:major facilitator superfamily transporter [Durotheca rogersii]|uniref:major facilitator superfamily transporter n=1 Tax=Durotheca rogersii TaxID=419775 RepID=UPI00221E83D2|nr:major facilitator superfamily transporter [Durotheca rogersii]KAI5855061.1 major facilitator superfamily transporter [Durotheca rogersii]
MDEKKVPLQQSATQTAVSSDRDSYNQAQTEAYSHIPARTPQEPDQSPERPTADAPSQYVDVKSLSFILVLVALSLSLFCVAIDNIIIATAIPAITDEFHAINHIGWYGSGYLLPTCAFQLLSGKLYSRYAAKWIFLGALFLFEVGSLISAVAPSSAVFIVGRAIAGVGAAALFTGSLVIVATIVPPEKAPAFQSVNAATFGVASAVAPLIGGAFTDNVTWRWCFYINLPIGGVSAPLVLFLLKTRTPAHTAASLGQVLWNLDLLGLVFFLPSIICFLLAMEWAGIQYDWSDWRIIVVMVFFGVLLVAFVADQFFMGEDATVPVRLAKQRTIAAVSWYNMFSFGAFNTAFYFIPLYFQGIKNTSAEDSGIRMIPLVVVQVVVIVITGILSAKSGHYVPFFVASCTVAAVGLGLLTTWGVDSSAGEWVGYQVLIGFGLGMGMQLFATAVSATLPDTDVPTGMALTTMAQFFGASIFLGVGNNVFATKFIGYVDALRIPGLDGHTLVSAGATTLRDAVPAEYLPQVLDAYMDALTWTFRISLILECLAIFGAVGMEWKRVRGHGGEKAPSANPSSANSGS